jgi:hypothetical protein
MPPQKKRRTQPYVNDEKGYRLKSGTFPVRFHNDGTAFQLCLVPLLTAGSARFPLTPSYAH